MGEYSYTMTTSIVGTDDGRETYEIRRTFDVEGKSAVLIALYPTVSLLNPIKMDSSTMYLLNHMHELGYNDIRIVNLFSKAKKFFVLILCHNYGIIITRKEEEKYMPKIIPIKELKNTSEVSDLCHKTNEPVYVTKNGYGDMVIMSMETFESLSERLKMYQSLMTSEQQIKEGKVKDARESLASMREKYAL